MLLNTLILFYLSNSINVVYSENVNNDLVLELIKEIDIMKKENEALKHQMDRVVRDNAELKNAVDTLTDMMEQPTNGHDDNKRLIPVIRPPVRAAFSVRLQQSAANLQKFQAIKFDDVVTNELNVYSPVTGAFTAPSNGTFYFTGTIMNFSGLYVAAEIAHNGNTVCKLYSRDTEFEQSSTSVILNLQRDDMVWMRHSDMEGDHVLGNLWSSFSGFQIY